jgi:anti-sigma regulatory factor (Ser/Thr protein kinase)
LLLAGTRACREVRTGRGTAAEQGARLFATPLPAPSAARSAPPTGRAGGRGLWLVNQLCDLVQVRSPAGGTTVRMTMQLGVRTL